MGMARASPKTKKRTLPPVLARMAAPASGPTWWSTCGAIPAMVPQAAESRCRERLTAVAARIDVLVICRNQRRVLFGQRPGDR